MPAVTLETSEPSQFMIWAELLVQSLPGLYVELLLYGTFMTTTLLTIRALLFVCKTPYECWKSQSQFVLTACVTFITSTCDVVLAIWFNSLLACMDSAQDEGLLNISYINYFFIHVRYIPIKVMEL
jgi:hypothetical protein